MGLRTGQRSMMERLDSLRRDVVTGAAWFAVEAASGLGLNDTVLPGLKRLTRCMLRQPLVRAGLTGLEDSGSDLTLDYLRYKPGRRCVAMYREGGWQEGETLVVSMLDRTDFQRFQNRISRRPEPSQCDSLCVPDEQMVVERFPQDWQLPLARKLLDVNHRSRIIRRLVGRCWDPRQVDLMAYKPARRVVFRVGNREGNELLLKGYTEKGYQQTLRRLQAFRSSVSVPQVMACSPRYHVIALPWISGEPLNAHFQSPQLEQHVFETGRQLARFHLQTDRLRSPWRVAASRLVTLAEDLARLHGSLGAMALELARVVQNRLVEKPDSLVVIHNDFYAKQVVLNQTGAHLIDLDQAGLGERWQDLGNFVAQLYWRSILGELTDTQVERLEAQLLEGYQSVASSTADKVRYRLHLAAGLLRCCTHPFRHARANWPSETERLLRIARRSYEASIVAG